MEQNRILKFLQSAAIGSAVASLLVVTLTIGGEEWPPLKNWLREIFFHHWLGKSILSIGLFTVVTVFLGFVVSGEKSVKAVWISSFVAAISAVAITFYFTLHMFQIF